MSTHGNSRTNKKDHHLYQLYDQEEKDIFKYGISDKPIGKDGQSSRMREQANYLNRAVGWLRYIAKVLITGIAGRIKARELEDEYIDAYEKKNGRRPRGNI